MRILFVCRNFHDMAGGIERMATWIMNEMNKKGHQVCLITWDKEDAVPHYEISKNILWNISQIPKTHLLQSFLTGFQCQLYKPKKIQGIFLKGLVSL